MNWILLAQGMVQCLVHEIVVMDHKAVSIFTIWSNNFHPKDCPITLTSSKIKFSAFKSEKKETSLTSPNIRQPYFNDNCWLRAYWGVTGGHSRTGDPDTRARRCTHSVRKFLAQSIPSHQKDEAITLLHCVWQHHKTHKLRIYSIFMFWSDWGKVEWGGK
jgi:hypothetical protein